MYEIFNKRYECYVYCDNLLNLPVNKITRTHLLDIISDDRNLVIYHHSVFWSEGEEILSKCKAMIIRYHNITPPIFSHTMKAIFPYVQKGEYKQKDLMRSLEMLYGFVIHTITHMISARIK